MYSGDRAYMKFSCRRSMLDQLTLGVPCALVLRVGKVRRELYQAWSAAVDLKVNFARRPMRRDRGEP